MVTKLKKSNCAKTQTQIVTKLKKSNSDKTQKLKLWQNSNFDTSQIGTKMKLWQNWNCNGTQIVTKLKLKKMYRSYYPHRSRDSMSPVCGIFILLSVGIYIRKDQITIEVGKKGPLKFFFIFFTVLVKYDKYSWRSRIGPFSKL